MSRADTDLVMVVTSDIAGQLRGKAFPRLALERRRDTGVGWTPTNVFITSFGPIADSPWGPRGDLAIVPDFATHVDLDLADIGVDENFVIGDVMTLDGDPWACCLRGSLKATLARLEERHGLRLTASFEHEFHYSGTQGQPGLGYALRAYRRLGAFPSRLMRVVDAAGLSLDTFSPEYGPGQCEVTVGPRPALHAADDATVLRELVRATARGLDARASFTPMIDPDGVGNGVHVHFGLHDLDGTPVNHDPQRPHGVSARAGSFLAGLVKYMPAYVAMTASAVTSYLRLMPNRWSAVYTNLGLRDREAAVRICPVFGGGDDIASRFHFEYRAGDAAASPYLFLAALVRAGTSGLDDALATPPVSETDPGALSAEERSQNGWRRLPQSLDGALDNLANSRWAGEAFGETLVDAFLRHKREEVAVMEGLTPAELCARYTAAY